MANKGLSLWQGNRPTGENRAPRAIVSSGEADSVFELSSIITDTRFDFDDLVIDSKAYRRALMNLRRAQSRASHSDQDQCEDSILDTRDHGVVGPSWESFRAAETDAAPDPSEQVLQVQELGDERLEDNSNKEESTTSLPEAAIDKDSAKRERDSGLDMRSPEDGDDLRFFNHWNLSWETFAQEQTEALASTLQLDIHESPPLETELLTTFTSPISEDETVPVQDVSPRSDKSMPAAPAEINPAIGIKKAARTVHQRSSSWKQRLELFLRPPLSSVGMENRLGDDAPSPGLQRKLVIVGDGGSGKTAMLIRFLRGFMIHYDIPTIYDEYTARVEVDGKHVDLALCDNSRLEDWHTFRSLSYHGCHAVLICFSVVDRRNEDNVKDKVGTIQARFIRLQ